jgi:EAL domain-containing protein (putative c-di-GMP-specific phosphodiesterase class I)
MFVTASIGIAMTRGPSVTSEDLLRNADTALYRAKQAGRARHVMFDDGMRQADLKQLDTQGDVQRALEQEEFCLFYQPIVQLSTGRIVGAEALLRWDHPKHGLLPPGQFLPFVEEMDLVHPLNVWVLEQASLQITEWRRLLSECSDLRVWVNISARQLARPDLAEAVADVLGRSGIDPTAILLEITEQGVMRDVDSAARTLWALRSLGVGLAVDDFGTGYSSLVHLRQFPLSAVKIDRSFVEELDNNGESTAIVTAVIGLAHALGLTVVAEGIESEVQLERLRDLGCDFGQGFLFALPASAAQIAETLRENPTG